MLEEGMRFAVFPIIASQQEVPEKLVAEAFVKVVLKPPIDSWLQDDVEKTEAVRALKKLNDFG
jgi:hypothetical protein